MDNSKEIRDKRKKKGYSQEFYSQMIVEFDLLHNLPDGIHIRHLDTVLEDTYHLQVTFTLSFLHVIKPFLYYRFKLIQT
jgi:hypothetical protein